ETDRRRSARAWGAWYRYVRRDAHRYACALAARVFRFVVKQHGLAVTFGDLSHGEMRQSNVTSFGIVQYQIDAPVSTCPLLQRCDNDNNNADAAADTAPESMHRD